MLDKSTEEWSPPAEVGILGLVLASIIAILASYNNFNDTGLAGIAFVALFVGNYIFEKWNARKNG